MSHRLQLPSFCFAFLFLGLLAFPSQSHAWCKGKIKIVNKGSRALIITYIALDIKMDKGKGWIKAKEETIKLSKGETKIISYKAYRPNCGKKKRAFQLKYYAQKGTSKKSQSSTNYERGRDFTITRTGRKSFKLSKGT